jgi:hypothetical protein
MPAGEIILVAYGEENLILSQDPQITFFKILYRRYSNFSMETIQTNFFYKGQFGKRYSVELSKIGDLLHKLWLIIELPEIPTYYNLKNDIDQKLKFKWTRKIAYALIDYIEIEIGGQIISRQWGEWMNVLEELNWNNFNSNLDQYIGNTPENNTYKLLKNNVNSTTLYIPLFFWFCNNSGSSLPLLCLEYTNVRLNIQFNNFESCAIFSPSNFIKVSKYFGNGILGEPLVQYSNQGIAWAEFDSIDISEYDKNNYNINNYNLYYRKISDNQFITSSNIDLILFNLVINDTSQFYDYVIYGLYSGSIYLPVNSDPNDPNSIYLQQNYYYNKNNNYIFNNFYLLCNYIYIDRDERKKFYEDKHEYIIEQVYFSNKRFFTNINNQVYFDIINPCKYFVFMAQVKYFLNYNVNELFNYRLLFFDNKKIKNYTEYYNVENKPVIRYVYYGFNSNTITTSNDMKFFNVVVPFNSFPKAKVNSGFGLTSFSLYPDKYQPSGSINLSYFNTFQINFTIFPIDIDYNQYVFKAYGITYNYLKVANGVAAPIFNSNF